MAKKTTINVNGVLTEVTEFDHSAQEIDDAVDRNVWQSNPDLLDNGYFVGGGAPGAFPINQRDGWVVPPGVSYYIAGQSDVIGKTTENHTVTRLTNQAAIFKIGGDETEYAVGINQAVRGYVGTGYTVDRWLSDMPETRCLLAPEGLKLTGRMCQRLENQQDYIGLKVTASVLLADGAFGAHSFIIGDAAGGFSLVPERVSGYSLSNIPLMLATTEETTIVAAKLELGSEQTLAHQENGEWVLNEIPNYAEQLARCQRHYVRYGADDAVCNIPAVVTAASGNSTPNFQIMTPVPMRALPALKFRQLVVRTLENTTNINVKESGIVTVTALVGASVGVAVTTESAVSVLNHPILRTLAGGYLELDANL